MFNIERAATGRRLAGPGARCGRALNIENARGRAGLWAQAKNYKFPCIMACSICEAAIVGIAEGDIMCAAWPRAQY